MPNTLPVVNVVAAALRGRNIRQLIRVACERLWHKSFYWLQRYVLRRRYIRKRVYDYRLILDSDDPGISRQLLRLGRREAEQKFILEHELKSGMTAFDLGANIGYYTVMMSKLVGRSGQIYAVEPMADNFALLQRNLELNDVTNVHCERIAIAATDSERILFRSDHSNWHSLHEPRTDVSRAWTLKYSRRIIDTPRIQPRALANYLSDKPTMDLVRMDLEGFEAEILSAFMTLPDAMTRTTRILMETHPEFYGAGGDVMRPALHELCSQRGFRIKYLVSDRHFGSRTEATETGAHLFARYGYGATHIVRIFRNRAIYRDIALEDAIELLCTNECVNAALLVPGQLAHLAGTISMGSARSGKGGLAP